MKKWISFAGILVFSFLVSLPALVFAQTNESTTTDWKQELSSDKEQMKAQHETMQSNAQAGRQEEKDLLKQIKDAQASGDMATAKSLRDQLHAMHQENMQQKQSDKEMMQGYKQELKSDRKEAHQELGQGQGNPSGYNPPGQGPVNPPGYNPPGSGPGNPPGYNPPGVGQGVRDKAEDRLDRREDVRDRKEDVRDRREDIADRREDRWDATHNAPVGTEAWRKDKAEDVRDKREDIADRKEDRRDRKEDVKDRREDKRDQKGNPPGRGPGNPPGRGPKGK